MKIFVRPAELKHLPDICRIEKESFNVPWSENELRALIESETSMMVAAVNEKEELVGYGAFMLMYDTAHIVNIAVEKAYRKAGIGKLIMVALLAVCERNGISEITLEVRPSNKAAIALYERCGFVGEGVRKGYYSDNHEDALIMWRHGEKQDAKLS